MSLRLTRSIFLLAWLLAPAALWAARIDNVVAQQDDARVIVEFDLAGATEKSFVSLLPRFGERALAPNRLSLSGDVGLVEPGPGKRIVWDAGADYPAGLAGPVDFEITAVDVSREPVSGLLFASLAGECFEMGCGEWNEYCEPDELPVFVACPGPFALSVSPVHNSAFAAFMNDTGHTAAPPGVVFANGRHTASPGLEEKPVSAVSREDAEAFAAWLSRRTGERFALPDEAQWEYACRSGGRLFPFGSVTGRMGGDLNSPQQENSGTNLLGCEDMSGGLWEWMADDYLPYPLYTANARPGQEGLAGVLRGGRIGSPLRNSRCANRYERAPDMRDATSTFRLVRLEE